MINTTGKRQKTQSLTIVFLFVLAVLTLGVGIPGLPGLKDLGIDNSIQVWLENDASKARIYREFTDKYGSDQILIAGIFGPRLLEEKSLEAGVRLVSKIEKLDGVVKNGVFSPFIVWRDFFDASHHDQFVQEITDSPFYRDLVSSQDGHALGLFIQVEPGGEKNRNRQLVTEIEKALDDYTRELKGFSNVSTALAGSPAVNAALDQGSSRDSILFFPCIVALSTVLLIFLFRNFLGATLLMLTAGTAVLLTLGSFAAAGRQLNMVTVALPSLVWILSLSHAIHIGSHIQIKRAEGETMHSAVRHSLRDLVSPCTLASLTTGIGFLTLTTSNIHAVQDLGLFASIGMGYGLAVSLLLLPSLCHLLPKAFTPYKNLIGRRSASRTFPGAYRPSVIFIASFLVFVVCAVGLQRVRAESNILAFFPEETKIVQDSKKISENLTGLYTLEIDMHLPEGRLSLESLHAIESFCRQAEKRPNVARVISITDLLKKTSYSLQSGEPDAYMLSQDQHVNLELIQSLKEFSPNDFKSFFNETAGTSRIRIFIRSIPSRDYYQLLDFAKQDADRMLAPVGIKTIFTGTVPFLIDLQTELVSSTIRSFGLAFIIITGVILLAMRNLRLTFAAFLPNLLPITAVYGAMGFFDIKLDAATMMVSSVAFGIGVDDTLHILCRYRQELAKTQNHSAALSQTRMTTGRALLLTTVVNAGGFAVLGLATFKPLIWFGLLTSLALVTALIGDFFLLPACLTFFQRKKQCVT